MKFHNFREFTMDGVCGGMYYAVIDAGMIFSYGGKIFIAAKNMVLPTDSGIQYWLDEGYIPWPEPGTDPTAWQEIPKDCDNCYHKAKTVKDNGNTPADEIETCPYAVTHQEETNQSVPDICQAWDPKVWPSLPPDPDPQVQHLNTPNAQNRDTLIARLKSGRVCRAEMQSILAQLV